ncbi:hypothetical protein C474_08862 [Halogeometricum pallidum JCM 14848]|uniref:Uncharacterized protein n=1 Tax=Halogeometricum pallidum JCM 14848 TaxID=1227487 RepID=M0D7C3_HALPD|nr:hypothetical protein [Halogeometricum pallidum]ELZ31400.1 hypothetical protein C474_08862 [Halogeometricum pallidum JCM 14848]
MEEFVVTDAGNSYRLFYLPDVMNPALNEAGEPMWFYWMMNEVRIARDPVSSDYKFHLTKFAGVTSESTHVGVEGDEEVAGGVLSVTTTGAPPIEILQKSQQQLIEKFSGRDERYWGIASNATPQFSPIPLASSYTAISNLSPTASEVTPTGGDAPEDRSLITGPPVPEVRMSRRNGSLRLGEARSSRSNLDKWYARLEGGGKASIDPAGENAFTGLLGSYVTAILWDGFHDAYAPVSVRRDVELMVWSPQIQLTMNGEWSRIFSHFSAAAQSRTFFSSKAIQAEWENLVVKGDIQVHLIIDGTAPDSEEMLEMVRDHQEVIFESFMSQAKEVIFEPPPKVEPAEAKGGIFGFGGGWSVKGQLDTRFVELNYTETIDRKYRLPHSVSSSLKGFYNEINADPEAADKYFSNLYLDDYFRKVTRLVSPVVNWPSESEDQIGDPVEYASCQIGYPDTNGEMQWTGTKFYSHDDAEWTPAFSKKSEDEVQNPPEGWTSDKTYVKRRIGMLEPKGENDSPYIRQFVEKEIIELDEGENGTLTNDIDLEVRADSAGKLEIGPMFLNVMLENNRQFVEVTIKPAGETDEGNERNPTRFSFQFSDQDTPRYLELYTGQMDFVPEYEYKVRCVERGTFSQIGREWEGPWVREVGNGPIMISVPNPESSEPRLLSMEESAIPPEEVGSDKEAVDIEVTAPDGATKPGSTASQPGSSTNEPQNHSTTSDGQEAAMKPRSRHSHSNVDASETEASGERTYAELKTIGGWGTARPE